MRGHHAGLFEQQPGGQSRHAAKRPDHQFFLARFERHMVNQQQAASALKFGKALKASACAKKLWRDKKAGNKKLGKQKTQI
jgi:hypothetical protein